MSGRQRSASAAAGLGRAVKFTESTESAHEARALRESQSVPGPRHVSRSATQPVLAGSASEPVLGGSEHQADNRDLARPLPTPAHVNSNIARSASFTLHLFETYAAQIRRTALALTQRTLASEEIDSESVVKLARDLVTSMVALVEKLKQHFPADPKSRILKTSSLMATATSLLVQAAKGTAKGEPGARDIVPTTYQKLVALLDSLLRELDIRDDTAAAGVAGRESLGAADSDVAGADHAVPRSSVSAPARTPSRAPAVPEAAVTTRPVYRERISSSLPSSPDRYRAGRTVEGDVGPDTPRGLDDSFVSSSTARSPLSPSTSFDSPDSPRTPDKRRRKHGLPRQYEVPLLSDVTAGEVVSSSMVTVRQGDWLGAPVALKMVYPDTSERDLYHVHGRVCGRFWAQPRCRR
eukprot:TRINITY_DN706_c0_g1_i1.p1 TRINITY_DN706_c0_g1~~TRINITY_DN706_c0_g1_i1.p1  ORF type:complete len:409 (-),score=90.17 TRINITY_DN706_c0_g1_i1:539-1765(-)